MKTTTHKELRDAVIDMLNESELNHDEMYEVVCGIHQFCKAHCDFVTVMKLQALYQKAKKEDVCNACGLGQGRCKCK